MGDSGIRIAYAVQPVSYTHLNVSDYRGVGEEKPYEFARSEVKDLLVNQKRVNFMEQVKSDLYQQAVDKKKIIYNY